VVVWASFTGCSSLKDHIDEMNSILMKLGDMNVKMKDKDIVVNPLVNLPFYLKASLII